MAFRKESGKGLALVGRTLAHLSHSRQFEAMHARANSVARLVSARGMDRMSKAAFGQPMTQAA